MLTLINPAWPHNLYPKDPWRLIGSPLCFIHERWRLGITENGDIEYRPAEPEAYALTPALDGKPDTP